MECSDEESDGKSDDNSSDGSSTFDMDEEVVSRIQYLHIIIVYCIGGV